MSSKDPVPPNLIHHLRSVLIDLCENPYPYVSNPPTTPKRASVALILRISPDYDYWPPKEAEESYVNIQGGSVRERLERFFAQDWVKHGDPEVLFIKRSSRKEDKWSSHVAFPGGRRDPEDEDDRAAAVRESCEEVGIDLSEENAISVGNLAQRVVTSSWGKTALMVLCPYVFVISKHDIAPLRLQPSEVASAHWVSLRALLSPSQRTVEFVDVANRYSRDLRRWHNHFLLGEMVFAAVRLIPSESSYSTSQSGFIPAESKRVSAASKLRRWWRNDPLPAPSLDVPLHLWGLTLGVMADFLDLLPPHNAIRLWIYPTFTAYDLQFILWVMSYRFKARKEELLLQGIADMGSPITLEDGVQAVPVRNESFAKPQLVDADGPHYDAGIEGLSLGRMARQPKRGSRSDAVGSLLEGYYDYIRRSIQVTMLTRTAVAATLLFYFIKRRRRI